MIARPLRFDAGSILIAQVRSKRGGEKTRPLVLLVTKQQIAEGEPLLCMAITTTYPEPAPSLCVELPWDPSGRCSTGLRQRSAAVVDWVIEIAPEDIVAVVGRLSKDKIGQILTRLAAIRLKDGG